MSDNDPLLGLMDDLLKLELPHGLDGVTIEVEADGFGVSVSRHGQSARVTAPAIALEEASVEKTQRVHATTVGLFSAAMCSAGSSRSVVSPRSARPRTARSARSS